MPSRVFDQLDVTVTVEGYTIGPTIVNSTFNFVNTNFGNWSFNGLGNDIQAGPAATVSTVFSYEKFATVNFQTNPRAIPDSALITRVRIRTPSILSTQAAGTVSPPGVPTACVASIGSSVSALISIAETFNDDDSVSHIWSESVLGSDADIIFDYSDAPIDFTTLVATHGTQFLQINGTTVGAGAASASSTAFASFNLTIENWELEVTWIETYQWNITQPQGITTGTILTITSPETATLPEVPLDVTEITDIDIVFPDGLGGFITVPVLTFTPITPNLMTLVFPDITPEIPYVVQIVLTSTQFSGTVSKQLYIINFVSASGIYELVLDKTTDTLYVEDDPGNTIDVQIPDPFGKTGFFGK